MKMNILMMMLVEETAVWVCVCVYVGGGEENVQFCVSIDAFMRQIIWYYVGRKHNKRQSSGLWHANGRNKCNCVSFTLANNSHIDKKPTKIYYIEILKGLSIRISDVIIFSMLSVPFNLYPTAFPYGNGMVLHFYQQQESSTTKTLHKVINKGLKAYV